MKFVLLFLLMSVPLLANTIDFVVTKMSERCIPREVTFTAIVAEKNLRQAHTLTLKKTGLVAKTPVSDDKKSPPTQPTTFDLKILNELVGCDGKKIVIERLKKYFKKASINEGAPLAQGLFGYQPVYIIGADQKDSTSPQVWIDKETFLPVKEIGKGYVATFDKPMMISAVQKSFSRIITIAATENSYTISLAEELPKRKISGG